jgi:hypothetical protein
MQPFAIGLFNSQSVISNYQTHNIGRAFTDFVSRFPVT